MVFEQFSQINGDVVAYGGIGSGGGVRNLRDKIVDFAASDAFLTQKEMTDMPQVIHIPTCMGAVVVAYNLDGGGSSTIWFLGKVLNKPTTYGDVFDFQKQEWKKHIVIKEQKTGKINRILINKEVKDTLELYSDKDHPHQRLDSLKINDNVLLNEITINQSGNFYVSIKDEHTILLEFRSEKQNKIGGLKNSNPNKAHNILKLWTGNLSETDKDIEDLFENIDESELIILKGDNL